MESRAISHFHFFLFRSCKVTETRVSNTPESKRCTRLASSICFAYLYILFQDVFAKGKFRSLLHHSDSTLSPLRRILSNCSL